MREADLGRMDQLEILREWTNGEAAIQSGNSLFNVVDFPEKAVNVWEYEDKRRLTRFTLACTAGWVELQRGLQYTHPVGESWYTWGLSSLPASAFRAPHQWRPTCAGPRPLAPDGSGGPSGPRQSGVRWLWWEGPRQHCRHPRHLWTWALGGKKGETKEGRRKAAQRADVAHLDSDIITVGRSDCHVSLCRFFLACYIEQGWYFLTQYSSQQCARPKLCSLSDWVIPLTFIWDGSSSTHYLILAAIATDKETASSSLWPCVSESKFGSASERIPWTKTLEWCWPCQLVFSPSPDRSFVLLFIIQPSETTHYFALCFHWIKPFKSML